MIVDQYKTESFMCQLYNFYLKYAPYSKKTKTMIFKNLICIHKQEYDGENLNWFIEHHLKHKFGIKKPNQLYKIQIKAY